MIYTPEMGRDLISNMCEIILLRLKFQFLWSIFHVDRLLKRQQWVLFVCTAGVYLTRWAFQVAKWRGQDGPGPWIDERYCHLRYAHLWLDLYANLVLHKSWNLPEGQFKSLPLCLKADIQTLFHSRPLKNHGHKSFITDRKQREMRHNIEPLYCQQTKCY